MKVQKTIKRESKIVKITKYLLKIIKIIEKLNVFDPVFTGKLEIDLHIHGGRIH